MIQGVDRRILGAFVALAAVLALLFGLGAKTLATIDVTAERVRHTRDVLSALDALQNALVEMETADRGFALSWDEAFSAPFARALPRALAAQDRIAALTSDNPVQVARMPKLSSTVEEAIETMRQSLEDTRTAATPGDEGADRFRLTQSKTDAVRAVIAEMRAEEENLLRARSAHSDVAVADMRWAGGALGVTCVTLLALAYMLLRRDATRRGMALDAVRESESRFRHLADNAPVMIWMADDRNGNYHFNRVWREFTGRSNEQEAGRGWMEGVHPADRERVSTTIGEADRTRRPYRVEYRLRRADGAWRWVLDTGTPRTGPRGEPEGFIGSCLDITDRRESEDQMLRLNRELATARDQALEASRLKSAFLANMSHELRTPLNGIIGYAEMLMQEDFETVKDHLEKAVSKIHGSGRHLLAIINDILDLSKIEAGKIVLVSEDFSAESIAREAAATVEAAAGRNRNALSVHVAPDAGTIASDSLRVKQVLLNLLSNACKFTEGGRVELDVSRQAAAEGDWVVFRISDTGIGMASAEVERLFQDFTQADGTTTRKYGGTGLGLSISRRLARLMGGEIHVRSEPGRGSVFSLLLPAQGGEPVESTVRPSAARFWEDALSEVTAPPSDRPKAPGVVLAIDDDENVHDMLRAAFRRDGLTLESASNGAEGIEIARSLRPSVIVLDVLMPRMDGWTTLSRLKADPETRDIPVVMLTMLDDRPMGYALGASDYLLKPLDRDSLRKAFERHGLRAAAKRITRSPDLPPPAPGHLPAAKPHALVVEDDPASQDLMRFFLQREGWHVEVAPDGVEALGAIAVSRPDIILLDLMMPRMDGFEFLAELRSIPETMDLPVIVMTAKDLTADDRARLEGAVHRIVQKGATPKDVLVEEVRSLVHAAARAGRSE